MKIIPNQAKKWYDEQVVAVLYTNLMGAILGSSINIALVSFVLWSIFPTAGLIAWLVCGQALNLLRFYLYRLYNNNITTFSNRFWLNSHRTLTAISGAMYGILAFFFFSSEHPLHQILVILLAGGMGAAAVGTHSVDRITYQLFLFLAVVPLTIRAYLEGTEVHMVVAAMLCLLMLIMLRAAEQSRQIMIDNIFMSQSLRYRATHDSLVDLLNRDEFQKEFHRLMQQIDRKPKLIAMIFIDLDNFKLLNDTLGHQAGDEALIKIGNIIRKSIRQSDIAARFGGDEFMILIQADSLDQARAVAEKIRLKIEFFQQSFNDINLAFGASMGIGYAEHHQCRFDSLLKAADRACYKAKHSGKGRICIEQATSEEASGHA
jgi:diguanylate cyclase (GGDEF)-like protein